MYTSARQDMSFSGDRPTNAARHRDSILHHADGANDDASFTHFPEDHDAEEFFMAKLVDGPCQGVFPDEGPCVTMLPACQATIDHQLDVLTVYSTVLFSLCLGAYISIAVSHILHCTSNCLLSFVVFFFLAAALSSTDGLSFLLS